MPRSGQEYSHPRGSIIATSGNLTGAHCLAIMRGIHAVCLERGWVIHGASTPDLAAAVKDYRPDAIIIVVEDAHIIPARALRGRVVVSAGQDLVARGWASVVPDGRDIGRQAARHLLERGLPNLAAFGAWHDRAGKIRDPWATTRIEGFAESARRAGIKVHRHGDRIEAASRRPEVDLFHPSKIQRWLGDLPRPCGVFAPCDGWGTMLATHCRDLGLRVPEDIALIGVDDIAAICETCAPPLSSVAIPWERMGRLAAEMVAGALAGKRLPSRLVVVPPTGVTVRRSSDALAVADPDVAAALGIIFAHADQPISVSEILRQVPVTQRRLERHFKKLVGRRIVEEIRRVHIERAKRLLADSDLPMPTVALQSGFSNSPRLAAAFRRETGTTPSKFRRRHRLRG